MRAFWGENWPAPAVIAATAIMILPLWLVGSPAVPDYPAHLASFYLLSGGIRHLSQFYRIAWAPIPNLAAEGLVPLLSPFIGVAPAAKLVMSLAIGFWTGGPALVQRALRGRIGLAGVAAAVFAYNANFMWGFINYAFATGLAFLVFAAWIATGRWRGPLRASVFATLVTAVYFSHVFAAATLLLLIGCYETMLWWESRPRTVASAFGRLLPILLAFLPAVLLFVFVRPEGSDGHVAFNLLDTWQDRIEAIAERYFDDPYYALLAGFAILLALGLWFRKISITRTMWLALAALFVAAAVMPEEAMGGWGVDLRLPPVFCAMLFAAAEVKLEGRLAPILGAALLLFIGFNAAALAGNWRYYDARYAEFRIASRVIPRGAKIVTVLDGDSIGRASDQPYWHMAEFAIIDRWAFTPLLFTTKGQHVIRLQPAYETIAALTAREGSPPDISELDDLSHGLVDGDTDIEYVFPYLMHFQCHFDDIVLIHLDGHRSPVPDMLRLVHAGSFFAIYRIVPRGCPAQ